MGYEGLKTIIGVDIGTDSLKAVLLERKGQQIQCLDLFNYSFPPGAEPSKDAILEGLRALELTFGKKTRDCALATSDRSVQLKFFDKPEMPMATLKEVVDREIKTSLALVEGGENLDFHYFILGKTRGDDVSKFQFSSAVFPQNLPVDLKALFKKAGFKLIGIFPYAMSLWECYQINHMTEIQENAEPSLTALLNFGSATTQIAVCDQFLLRLGRIFPSAGEELTQSLAHSYKIRGQERIVSRDEAETMKKQLGILSQEELKNYAGDDLEVQISIGLRRGVERMAQKLRLSLDYFKGQMKIPVTTVYVAGGGANMHGILDCLGDLLMIPEVHELFPFVNINFVPQNKETETPNQELGATVALAVGAGLCGMRDDSETLNLMAHIKFDIMPYLRKMGNTIGLGAVMAVFGALIIGIYAYYWYIVPTGELKTLTQKFAAATSQQSEVANLPKELKTLEDRLKENIGQEQFLLNCKNRRVFWSNVLLQLEKLLPSNLWLNEFNTLDKTAKSPNAPLNSEFKTRIKIKGRGLSNTEIAQFLQKLEGSPMFTSATMGDSKRETSANIITFTYNMEGEVIASETHK